MFSGLQKQLLETKGIFGLYIENVTNNNTLFELNQDETFPSASVAKIFIAGFIDKLIKDKKLSINELIQHTEEDTLGGSGVLKLLETDKSYSINELLKLMLLESDNTASKMLIRHLGVNNINSYLKSHEYLKISRLKVENNEFVGWGISTPFESGTYFRTLVESSLLVSNILKEVDSTNTILFYIKKPYEPSDVVVYSKGGTLHPRVKNIVSYLEFPKTKFLVSYFSKDLKNVHMSKNIIRVIGKELLITASNM